MPLRYQQVRQSRAAQLHASKNKQGYFMSTVEQVIVRGEDRPRWRWHILVFLAPALLVYTAVMILPLIETLRLSLFNVKDNQSIFVGFGNFQVLFGDPRW